MDAGQLVPDDLVIDLVAAKLAAPDVSSARGWLLDGFPRTLAQAQALARVPGARVDRFLCLEVRLGCDKALLQTNG
jgi:adenylate kinase